MWDKSQWLNKDEHKNKKKVDKIKDKGKVEDVKEEGVVRLLSVNFNGFGICSAGKIEQLKVMSKLRNTDGLMISSSDIRWNVKNQMKITYELKNANKNVVINKSDSGEEAEDRRWFLKGGTLTALWSSIVNYVDTECTHKQECG